MSRTPLRPRSSTSLARCALLTMLLVGGAAQAADAVPALTADDPDAVVEVIGTNRWTHTRWVLGIQFVMPRETRVLSQFNAETYVWGFDVRTVIACEPTTRRTVQLEVACAVEDAEVQLAPTPERARGKTASIAKELADDLTGARIALVVTDDGRITSVRLEQFPADRPRERARLVTARALANLGVQGLQLPLPPGPPFAVSSWTEKASSSVRLPFGIANQDLALTHQLGLVDGRLLVHSQASGVVVVAPSDERVDATSIGAPLGAITGGFQVDYQGFARLDPDTGDLLERAWQLKAVPTAGNSSSWGKGRVYVQIGRLRRLGADEVVTLGPDGMVSPPSAPQKDLPPWPALKLTSFDGVVAGR